ncbi:MAG: hypothetical protein PHE79_05160 [Eubacteriales bacterium]|nr:hypothetical protein [Eubacteriales bacterium]
MSVINQAKKEYDAAKAKGDKAGMEAAHAKADQARGYATYTTVQNGQYVQTKAGTNPSSRPNWLNATAPEATPRATPSANDYYTDYMDKMQSLIDENDRAQREALRRQTESTISSINSNIPKINQDYEGQQRAAYIQNTKAKTGMGDYLSAMGYSGGMSESTALGLQSGYENLRNTNDQQKNNALMEIQNLVAQAQATGDTNLAQLATQKYQSMLSAMQSARQQAGSMAQWESDNAFRTQQYIDSREQQAWENKFAQDQFSYQQNQDAIANSLAQARASRSGGGSSGGTANDAYMQLLEGNEPVKYELSNGPVTQQYPAQYTQQDVYNLIVANKTPEGALSAAQRMIQQGVNENYIAEALRRVGLQ